MTGVLIFDGKSSREFGLYISGSGTFNAPQRDIETVEIPGKNGTLTIDKKRFLNITISYPAFIREKFRAYTDAAREWLLAAPGYRRLEDSYHPEEYRMARFTGPLDWDARILNRSGECTLDFDCMPQRFLKMGEIPHTLTASGTFVNPTVFEAKPLFRVYGTSGTLMVGNTAIEISEIEEYIDIDCDTQNAYKGTENCNSKVTPAFPTFPVGQTGVMFSGGITSVTVIPRWWTI